MYKRQEQGYDFLRQAIASYYGARGVSIDAGEVFVSDGAKSDVGNITDIFSNDNVIMIPDPVYPCLLYTSGHRRHALVAQPRGRGRVDALRRAHRGDYEAV